MENHYKKLFGLTLLTAGMALSACHKTLSQKAEDKAEDAAHETNQAVERAGENMHDATH